MATGVSALGLRVFQSTHIPSQMRPYSDSRARLLRLGDIGCTDVLDCAVSPIRPTGTNCTIE